MREVSGIGQRSLNALRGERGVAANDLAGGQPVCQIGQYDGDRNSRAANASLAVKNGRIDLDVFLPVHERVPPEKFPEVAQLSNVCE